jgi:hypothetical protein
MSSDGRQLHREDSGVLVTNRPRRFAASMSTWSNLTEKGDDADAVGESLDDLGREAPV